MGDLTKAAVELKRLTADYPESEYVERAHAILREIQSPKEKAGH
jgi:outer membrane protein assembly factor BamD (BamD/ComL family)